MCTEIMFSRLYTFTFNVKGEQHLQENVSYANSRRNRQKLWTTSSKTERPGTPRNLKEHFSGPRRVTSAYLLTQSPTHMLR